MNAHCIYCLKPVMPHNRLPRIKKKTTDQKAEGTRRDQWRDLWMCETRTGQHVDQLHDSLVVVVVMMTDIDNTMIWGSTYTWCSKHYFRMYNTVHGYLNLNKALRKSPLKYYHTFFKQNYYFTFFRFQILTVHSQYLYRYELEQQHN